MTRFDLLATALAVSGGFTLDVRTMTHPSSGYVVSTCPEHEHTIAGIADSVEIARYLYRHSILLHEPGKLLGAWLDRETGTTYLDVVSIVPTYEEAVALAEKHGQLAVYHLDTATELRIAPDNGLAA